MLHTITYFIRLSGQVGNLWEISRDVLYFRATIFFFFFVMGVELDFTFQLKGKETLKPEIRVTYRDTSANEDNSFRNHIR